MVNFLYNLYIFVRMQHFCSPPLNCFTCDPSNNDHVKDLFNIIVFIPATDHMITMLCHVTKYCGWQKHLRFH